MKDDYDGAEPSGNSVAVMNLLRAAQLTGNPGYQEQADAVLKAFHQRLSLVPASVPQMLAACEFIASGPCQIVIASEGTSDDGAELLRAIHGRFLPGAALIHIDSPAAGAFFAAAIPSIEPMRPVNGRAAAYVCRGHTCQLPVTTVAELTPLLQ
jgi:uncharacterized protein YyaL (SSP411 family)